MDEDAIHVAMPGTMLEALEEYIRLNYPFGTKMNYAVPDLVRKAIAAYLGAKGLTVKLTSRESKLSIGPRSNTKEFRKQVKKIESKYSEVDREEILARLRVAERCRRLFADGFTLKDLEDACGLDMDYKPLLDDTDIIGQEEEWALDTWLDYFGYP